MTQGKGFLIDLKSMEDIKSFANTVVKYDSDVNIYQGSKSYDAKSIIAIFALDTSIPRFVEIISNDKEEIDDFARDMEKFVPTKEEQDGQTVIFWLSTLLV